jgi:hypothetical protein
VGVSCGFREKRLPDWMRPGLIDEKMNLPSPWSGFLSAVTNTHSIATFFTLLYDNFSFAVGYFAVSETHWLRERERCVYKMYDVTFWKWREEKLNFLQFSAFLRIFVC